MLAFYQAREQKSRHLKQLLGRTLQHVGCVELQVGFMQKGPEVDDRIFWQSCSSAFTWQPCACSVTFRIISGPHMAGRKVLKMAREGDFSIKTLRDLLNSFSMKKCKSPCSPCSNNSPQTLRETQPASQNAAAPEIVFRMKSALPSGRTWPSPGHCYFL